MRVRERSKRVRRGAREVFRGVGEEDERRGAKGEGGGGDEMHRSIRPDSRLKKEGEYLF